MYGTVSCRGSHIFLWVRLRVHLSLFFYQEVSFRAPQPTFLLRLTTGVVIDLASRSDCRAVDGRCHLSHWNMHYLEPLLSEHLL